MRWLLLLVVLALAADAPALAEADRPQPQEPTTVICVDRTHHRVDYYEAIERCEAPPQAWWQSRRVRRHRWVTEVRWTIPPE